MSILNWKNIISQGIQEHPEWEDWTEKIEMWKQNPSQTLLITGPSWSGKTSLWKSQLEDKEYIHLEGEPFKKLEFYYRDAVKKLGGKPSSSYQEVQKMLKSNPKKITFTRFHLLPRSEKIKLAEHLKRFSDDESSFWLIEATTSYTPSLSPEKSHSLPEQEQKQENEKNPPLKKQKTSSHNLLLQLNKDLRGRVVHIHIHWTKEALQNLLKLVQEEYKLNFSEEEEKLLLKLSFGHPFFLLKLCEELQEQKRSSFASNTQEEVPLKELFSSVHKIIEQEAKEVLLSTPYYHFLSHQKKEQLLKTIHDLF